MILAHDKILNCKRIIKKILKNEQEKESIQAEILILERLDREGIPKIYDIKETGDYFYIIEEYIQGRTLWEIIRSDGPFDLHDAVFYSRQLTEIIIYLHSIKPDAVLHLDIQPKNIIIHNRRLHLIDFGNAAYANEVTEKRYFKGTPGFAAPEQYNGENLDQRTDLYGIGACMAYMITGRRGKEAFCKTDGYIWEVIQGCIMSDPAQRYPSVRFLQDKLGNPWIFSEGESEEKEEGEGKKENRGENRNRRADHTATESVVLAFAGTQHRMGTSRIALEFTAYLTLCRMDAGYQEGHDGQLISRILKEDRTVSYNGGEFCYHGIKLRPSYQNTGIELDCGHDIVVRDEGVFSETMTACDILVMVAGIRSWEMEQTRLMVRMAEKYRIINRGIKIIWLWNLAGGQGEEKYIKELGISGFTVPFFKEYMKPENQPLFRKLSEEAGLWAEKGKS